MAKRRKLQTKAPPRRPPLKVPEQEQQQQTKKKQPTKQQLQHQQRQRDRPPTIPFGPLHRILLIGEADLSFAASIIRHHGCKHVTATVLEKNRAELVDKYPAAEDNIAVVEDSGAVAAAADDKDDDAAAAAAAAAVSPDPDSEPELDFDSDLEADPEADLKKFTKTGRNSSSNIFKHNTAAASSSSSTNPPTNKLLYNIDATKPTPSLNRQRYDRILFNFPHVGGKSTDVNRQVRYNQELLVAFFGRALPLLAPGGSIIVTLFEGEPYTLWNVRDLARHTGLQVDSSFRFQPAAYPGYHHARTIGVVRNKKGQEGGGWKGEDRPSRSYVFMRKGDVKPQGESKKRRRGGDDSSDDED